MESWSEKYRPKGLSEIIGNTKTITQLKIGLSRGGKKRIRKE